MRRALTDRVHAPKNSFFRELLSMRYLSGTPRTSIMHASCSLSSKCLILGGTAGPSGLRHYILLVFTGKEWVASEHCICIPSKINLTIRNQQETKTNLHSARMQPRENMSATRHGSCQWNTLCILHHYSYRLPCDNSFPGSLQETGRIGFVCMYTL